MSINISGSIVNNSTTAGGVSSSLKKLFVEEGEIMVNLIF
jgi:hypothetical protein